MSTYEQKKQAAHQKVEQQQLAKGVDITGAYWEEKPFHVMYYVDFPDYFVYKILGVWSLVDESANPVWTIYQKGREDDSPSPFEAKQAGQYETPLALHEVSPFLEEEFGTLDDPEDYQYLVDILSPVMLAKFRDNEGYQLLVESRKARALQWLNARAASGKPVAGGEAHWALPRNAFLELMHSLFEAKALIITGKGGRAAVVEGIAKLWRIEGKEDYHIAVSKLGNRKKSPTPLLDLLKASFLRKLAE